jgi:hypothetical protein
MRCGKRLEGGRKEEEGRKKKGAEFLNVELRKRAGTEVEGDFRGEGRTNESLAVMLLLVLVIVIPWWGDYFNVCHSERSEESSESAAGP